MEQNKLKNDSNDIIGDGTFELAQLSSRFIALVIDNVILGIISSIIGGIIGDGLSGVVIYFLLQTAFQWYFLLYHNGQTPGKTVTHTRVVKADGTPLTGADATMRSIGYFINNVLFGLGWLYAAFDTNYQGIQDKLAKTYVVKA